MEKLLGLIQPILEEHQVILYELKWRQEQKRRILSIAIMFEDGSMDIDTCANVSESVSSKLDEVDLIDHEYYLEVCSAGAERKLRNLAEIEAAINSYVKIKLSTPILGKQVLLGDLVKVVADTIYLEVNEKNQVTSIEVAYHQIKEIRLAIKF